MVSWTKNSQPELKVSSNGVNRHDEGDKKNSQQDSFI